MVVWREQLISYPITRSLLSLFVIHRMTATHGSGWQCGSQDLVYLQSNSRILLSQHSCTPRELFAALQLVYSSLPRTEEQITMNQNARERARQSRPFAAAQSLRLVSLGTNCLMATRQEDAIITANELSRLFGSPAFFAGRARDTPLRFDAQVWQNQSSVSI